MPENILVAKEFPREQFSKKNCIKHFCGRKVFMGKVLASDSLSKTPYLCLKLLIFCKI